MTLPSNTKKFYDMKACWGDGNMCATQKCGCEFRFPLRSWAQHTSLISGLRDRWAGAS